MEQKVRPTPRLAPLPPGHTPELKENFEAVAKSLGFIPNSVLIMQRKPKLVKAFTQLLGTIWDPGGEVDRGFKRLVAHVASRAAGCQYCKANGVTDEMFAEMRKYWSESQIVEIVATGEKFLSSHGWTPGKHAPKTQGVS
jgi:alkylhydroperoxidase family enzyme